MSKVKFFLRRFICSLSILCILFLTCISDYFGVRSYDVYATGTGISALMYVIEAALASYGYSFSSQADLQTSAEGFNYYVQNYPDDIVHSASAATIKTWLTGDLSYGTDVLLSPETFDFVKDSILYLLEDNSSASVTPIYSFSGLTYADISSINAFLNKRYTIFNQVDDGAGHPIITGNFDFDAQTENRAGFFYGLYQDSANFLLPSKKDAVPVSVNGGLGFKFYSPSSGGYVDYINCCFTIKNGAFYYSYNEPKTLSHVYDKSNFYYRASRSYTPIISANTKVYSSTSEAALDYKTKLSFPVTGKLYGSSSVAKSFSVDDSGNISIPISGTYTAAQVEKAIADALAANPSATQEDLDAVAAQAIANKQEIEEEIGASTETLASMIKQVEAVAKANSLALDELSSQISQIGVINGTSAEKLESIADQFDVVSDNASPEPDNNEDPKVWLPVVPDVVKFLKPLLDFIADPLSEITKFLNKITGQIEEIPQSVADAFKEFFGNIVTGIEELPDNMADAFKEFFGEIVTGIQELPKNIADSLPAIDLSGITLPDIEELPDNMADAFKEFFGEIVTGIQELPKNIADSLPAIDLSGITLPDAIDYSDILNDILSSLQEAFLIDTNVLSAHIGGLKDIWSDKIPFMDNISDLYDAFNFSDDYNYPVIKIATPDILNSYYDDDYIILLDFEEYKKYTLWCRNIVKAWLWFCFGLSILNHFRTNISIG